MQKMKKMEKVILWLRSLRWRWNYAHPKDVFYIDFFINPLPLFAMVLMGINDHYLKNRFPGWFTGKLSDFCGAFYFPLFLSALYILSMNLLSRMFFFPSRSPFRLSYPLMVISSSLTALLMVLIKWTYWGNQVAISVLNLFGFSNKIVMDPSDLISLGMLYLSYKYARHYFCS